MSDNTKPQRESNAPSEPRKPNGVPDEIPILQMRPASVGAGMLQTGDQTRTLTSRVKGQPGYGSGYEITWVRQRRAFRVDHYLNDAPNGTRWVPEARVDEYVEA